MQNKRRDADVFGSIYNKLFKKYRHLISDSRSTIFICCVFWRTRIKIGKNHLLKI